MMQVISNYVYKHIHITVALPVLLTDPKIIQQTNMSAYSKAGSTWLTGINTIIADEQVMANSPFV